MEVMPWQTAGLLARFGLTEAQCQTAVQFVDEQGKVFSGAGAANQTLKRLGGAWRVASGLYALPGFHQLEDAAYAWVARNRYRLPGGTPECKIDKREE
jgi:predicted DCC family thiol-disulfide oxidoreductase YuxK